MRPGTATPAEAFCGCEDGTALSSGLWLWHRALSSGPEVSPRTGRLGRDALSSGLWLWHRDGGWQLGTLPATRESRLGERGDRPGGLCRLSERPSLLLFHVVAEQPDLGLQLYLLSWTDGRQLDKGHRLLERGGA